MAKHPKEAGKPNLTPIHTHKRFFHPYPTMCGVCGNPAEYELYDTRQPHCRNCMLDAVDSQTFVMVRTLNGFDDAS